MAFDSATLLGRKVTRTLVFFVCSCPCFRWCQPREIQQMRSVGEGRVFRNSQANVKATYMSLTEDHRKASYFGISYGWTVGEAKGSFCPFFLTTEFENVCIVRWPSYQRLQPAIRDMQHLFKETHAASLAQLTGEGQGLCWIVLFRAKIPLQLQLNSGSQA